MESESMYYVGVSGHQLGPLTAQQVMDMIRDGKLGRDAHVFRSEREGWVPIGTQHQFAALLPRGRLRGTRYGSLAAAIGFAGLVVALKSPTITRALGDPYWAQMTFSEYLIVAIPIGVCGFLLLAALVMAVRRR